MTGADTADHGRSAVDGMSVLTFPGTGADSADHGRSRVDGMSVLMFPGTDADSADHGRSGVDGISLPTFPVTGAESPVTLILETTGSLFQSMFLLTHPITYSAANVHSHFLLVSLFFSKSPSTSGSRIHNTTNIVASCV